MSDKSFISRWSRLKSERAAEAQTLEDAPGKTDSRVSSADNITSDPSASGLSASNLSVSDPSASGAFSSDLAEPSTAFPEAQSDEQPFKSHSLNDDNDNDNDNDQSLQHNQAHEQEPADKPLLTDADMPPIESLGEKSDFSQFLSSGVSDELRNLALRKLFNMPQFNVRDGLNDYDDDLSKIPVLAQEVAAKMRGWLHEKQEQLTSELNEELNEALTQKPSIDSTDASDATEQLQSDTQTDTSQENAGKPHNNHKANRLAEIKNQDFTEIDDDLGDADLQG
ncbi:DUF3306 domain-containing protein [Neptunomonas qingdaonensis]|uniref:DUF3306 domain-containing protein n=1 Tax=Neptunomonas qingdaonensis TaxID=1045558 RepID=A0A1I2RN23_9GAMM|nr:DUF3306 domain-containing protein [Neptunomonas qingdaonensis]SFG39231.1 Protein of unknown function [Neptunomonas qingdaonensis]